MRPLPVVLLILAACGKKPIGTDPAPGIPVPIQGPLVQGEGMLGKPAPSLDGVRWVDGKEHPLSETRGKVVLVRWWTSTCPLCRNSARAFKDLKAKYGDDLAVRAIFHEKPAGRALEGPDEAEAVAKRLGFPGLVGHDPNWPVLRRWWLDGGGRRYTSVTFLLDQEGRVRLIHTGGEFHSKAQVDPSDCVQNPDVCAREYEAVDQAIRYLVSK